MASKLYAAAQAIAAEPVKRGPSQLIKKTSVEPTPEAVDALGARIEKAYPKMVANENAVRKAGYAPDGETRMVLLACKQGKPSPASVTVYYNGTVVWTGVEPV